jgi:putative oxidoreductase
MTALGLAVLRLSLAAILVAHGAHELFGVFAGPGVGPGGLSATSAYLAGVGLTRSLAFAVAGGFIQLAGGVLIGLGFLTRWASLVVVAYLAALVWKAHLRWGFFMNWTIDPARGHGIEYFLLIAGGLVCLALVGGGELSIDGRRATRAAARALGRARLRTRA